ncbi:putative WD domain, G-beta repeat/BING4CT (NUC141) domain containing protein [Leishmania naiffi]|uniref:WD domain, G-beta repeat/BING4CT (NUC141) domain containing protein n=1 Tax=Leishmania naiffi TaxID=5678 RepID=A0AAW3C517_9TRYP
MPPTSSSTPRSSPPVATTAPRRGGAQEMSSKEIQELVDKRMEELKEETVQHEKKFIQGRWVTDTAALRNRGARQREALNRQAPKRLAKVNMYYYMEEANTGLLLDDHEVADRISQRDIASGVDLQTQQKRYSLVLDKLGPYKIDFSMNGTHLLLAGLRGHMANINWKSFQLEGETQLKDRISDAVFLVDHSMTAVAQKKFVYMYTKKGTEMHLLSKMAHMDRLGYLPKHMLLAATSSIYSTMQYLDISTGQEVGTKVPAVMRDPTSTLAVNPSNGVTATCDLRGIVKFWSPAVVDPLLQLKGHKGVIEDICFHPNGRFFLTLGGDHKMKVWDCRTLRTLEEYAVTYSFHTLNISSSGLVALGGGTHVHIWKDMFTAAKPSSPYMKFGLGYGNIAEQVKFCPFEDVIGIGHSRGFTSLLIPGSGEANPDFYYANPHETERHRKERVVANLLDKLPPDTISMDIQVPGVDEKRLAEYNENLRLNRKARAIREKKMRRAGKSLGEAAPTGLLVGRDEEVDEELGYKEAPKTREVKSKQELQRERKMAKWDKKDSADKVRSKQTLRASRIAQRNRMQMARDARNGVYDEDALDAEEAEALAAKSRAAKQHRKRARQEVLDMASDIRGQLREDFDYDVEARPAAHRRRQKSHDDSGTNGHSAREHGSSEPEAGARANAALRRFLR